VGEAVYHEIPTSDVPRLLILSLVCARTVDFRMAVDQVGVPVRGGVGLGRDRAPLTSHDPGDAADAHQAGHLIPSDVATPPAQAAPQLEDPVQAVEQADTSWAAYASSSSATVDGAAERA